MNSITFLKYALGTLITLLSIGYSFAQYEFLGYSWTGDEITSVLDSATNNYFGLGKSRHKSIYEHDNKGFPIAFVNYIYDESKGWLKETKTSIEYDDRGNIMAMTNFYWYGLDSLWRTKNRQQFRYNDENKVEWTSSSTWDEELAVFPFKYYQEYEYSAEGNLISEKNYMLDEEDQFFLRRSINYLYNSSGQLEVKNSTFTSDQRVLSQSDSASFSYDDQGRLVVFLRYRSAGDDNPSERIRYKYNNEGQVSNMIYEPWSWQSENWEFSKECNFTYDKKGNLIQSDTRSYNGAIDGSITYTYDRIINAANIRVLPFDIYDMGRPGWFHPRHKMPAVKAMNTCHSGYYNKIFYFSDRVTLNNETLKEEGTPLNVFPNPVKRFLSIQNEIPEPVNLTLYDLTGRIVFSKLVDQKASLDLENLKKGVYVYHLETSEAIKKGKIVKE